MKIEVGKHYRRRDGRKVCVEDIRSDPTLHFVAAGYHYTPEGMCAYRGCINDIHDQRYSLDLIAEWPDAPDLTAITTPFGLLDDATREALKAHGGPYELWNGKSWVQPPVGPTLFALNAVFTYRVKPTPPKPREWWLVGNCLWDDYTEAYNACDRGEKPVKVREVTDDAK